MKKSDDSILKWKEKPQIASDLREFVAEMAWRRAFCHDEYTVYSWKGEWAFSRPDHPILGKLHGRVDELDQAKLICQNDYSKQQRLRRWNLYMLDNDPPLEFLQRGKRGKGK